MSLIVYLMRQKKWLFKIVTANQYQLKQFKSVTTMNKYIST